MFGGGRAEMIMSKGCSKMYADMTCAVGADSFRDLQPPRLSSSNSPFSGLVICVTGLSKETKKQVMDATEKLGGQFSPHLHPKCTHLVIQSSYEVKSGYPSKHGAADDLFIVTLGWFVDSVRRNARLNESLYGIKSLKENYTVKDDLSILRGRNSCSSVANLIPRSKLHYPEENKKTRDSNFSASRLHLSPDLACHVGWMLGNVPGGDEQTRIIKSNHKENQRIVILAKEGVRNRRSIKPSTRSILLDSITWTMSEPSSTAYICTDSFSFTDDKVSEFVAVNENAKEPDACFMNFLRPLSEREKSDLVYENHFITILFPVDRFSEMGLCSRTFFSNTGFTCSQLLDHIYAFYQENMSRSEIELAIHTDSRHADRLRSMYSSKEAAECGFVEIKRINFLGSRRSFKMLKCVSGDGNKNVYELLTQA